MRVEFRAAVASAPIVFVVFIFTDCYWLRVEARNRLVRLLQSSFRLGEPSFLARRARRAASLTTTVFIVLLFDLAM